MSALLRLSSTPLVRVIDSKAVACASARHFLWFGKKDNVRFPKDIDHATGEEKLVRLAIAKGIKDPYDVQEQVRGPGTKDNPNVIQTFEGSRLIGCKCEEDSTSIKYMWLHLNEPKRCECGFWFKAVPARKFWEEVGK